jgi:hypothetical protein
MNRLLEQMNALHPQDTVEGSIARKRYYLRIYQSLKADAIAIIQSFALRTGHSIFESVDPSIAPYLPPNSLHAILNQFTNPTRGRPDETPHDIISGRDGKRIKYLDDYFRAKRAGRPLPKHPEYKSENDIKLDRLTNPNYNKIVANQIGQFGQDRPVITTGNKPLGRSNVHISVVNPTANQQTRGLPFQVDLKQPRADLDLA